MTRAPWRSAFVAALFALHPLHVESVAWIAERKDVLSAFFFMLTLWAYIGYVGRLSVISDQSSGKQKSTNYQLPATGFYVLTLVFFAFGLMSKPMVVTLPFVLLLLDYWPLERTRFGVTADVAAGFSLRGKGAPIKGATTGKDASISRARRDAAVVCDNDAATRMAVSFGRLVVEKLPFFALSAASCVVTVWAQRSGGAVASVGVLAFSDRLANAVVSYVWYIGKMFWPANLAVFYPYRAWPLGAVLGAGAILLGIWGVVAWRARRNPHLLVGWLWYLGTLVPVIGLVQAGGQAAADRYTYIPLIGLFMMLAWAVPDRVFGIVTDSAPQRNASAFRRAAIRVLPRVLRSIIAVMAIALLLACAVSSRAQLGYWQNSETLYRHDLQVARPSWTVLNNLALALVETGKIPEATKYFEQALRLQPDYAESHYNFGLVLAQQGQLVGAIEQWQEAVRINPDYAEAQFNLGIALQQTGKPREAVKHFQQVVRIKPSAEAYYNLGNALVFAGKLQDSIRCYEEALRLKPDYVEARNNLKRVAAALPEQNRE
ncbi:MAG TPA: tetratricopeptide repeat protein, partial [Verrucomicrobiae bacterium]|nr:tetratricopeptide repeat protein [Verrucomicrobiae bacterium]